MEKSADITIIIVTYNSEHIIHDALDNAPQGYPIIIVDNASTDATCEKIESHSRTDVQLIRSEKNGGYGAGNNIGLKQCETRYALILNPDAEITADSIEKLKSALQQHETAVLAGPRVLKSKADLKKKQIKIKLYPLLHKNNPVFRLKLRFWVRRSYKVTDFTRSYECGFISGAVMLYDLQKMPEIIYFDEYIFMYHDEAEWQYRILNDGYKILKTPSAVAYHASGASSSFTNEADRKWNKHYNMGKTEAILAKKYPHKINKIDIILFITINKSLAGISYLLKMHNHVIKYSARLQGFKDGMQQATGKVS